MCWLCWHTAVGRFKVRELHDADVPGADGPHWCAGLSRAEQGGDGDGRGERNVVICGYCCHHMIGSCSLGCSDGLSWASICRIFAEFANLSWFARRCAERKHLKFVCNLGQAISCPVDDKGHGQGRYSESSCDRSDKSLWHVWEILRTIVWICLNVWIFMSDQLRLAKLVVSEWVAVSRRALDLPVISVILYNCGRRARAHLGIAVPFLWAESQGVFMDVFAVTLPMEAWLVSLQPAHLDFIHSCVESACSSENSGQHDACCNSVNDWIAGFKSVISCKLQSDCSHNFPYLCECWNRVEIGLCCSTWSTR